MNINNRPANGASFVYHGNIYIHIKSVFHF